MFKLLLIGIAIVLVAGVALPAAVDTYVAVETVNTQSQTARAVAIAEQGQLEAQAALARRQAEETRLKAEADLLKAHAEATRISAEADLIRTTSLSTAEALRRQREMDNGLGVNMNARVADGNPITAYESQQVRVVATQQAGYQATEQRADSAEATSNLLTQLLLYAIIGVAVLLLLRRGG